MKYRYPFRVEFKCLPSCVHYDFGYESLWYFDNSYKTRDRANRAIADAAGTVWGDTHVYRVVDEREEDASL